MGGDEVGEITNLAEPPHSIASAKIDDKGRLKLPSESLDWCKKSNIVSVFVTTLDKKTVRIYPIPVWKSTLKLLEAPGPDAKTGLELARIAKWYGGDADIDAQGRIMLPSELRTLLGLESQPVCLEHCRGRIDVTTKKVHDALLQAAESNLDEKVETFAKLGL
jgi:MraZ protein